MKIPVAVSHRHVHLTKEDKDILFGTDHTLTSIKPLSQKGQFACEEKVTIKTENGMIEGLRILGPERKYTQVELTKSDAYKLKINPPLRDSGDLTAAETVTIIGPKGSILAKNSTIIAHRHIHMDKEDLIKFNVKDGEVVSVKIDTDRGGIFDNVHVKADDSYVLEFHIDTDEANAFNVTKGVVTEIVK